MKLRMNSPAAVRSTTTAASCAATSSRRARAEEDAAVTARDRSCSPANGEAPLWRHAGKSPAMTAVPRHRPSANSNARRSIAASSRRGTSSVRAGNRIHAHVGEADAQDAGDQGQDDRFAEQLPQTAAARAEGEPNGDLAPPRCAVDQQQRRALAHAINSSAAEAPAIASSAGRAGPSRCAINGVATTAIDVLDIPFLSSWLRAMVESWATAVSTVAPGEQPANAVHRTDRRLPSLLAGIGGDSGPQRGPHLRASRDAEVRRHDADYLEGNGLPARSDRQQAANDGGNRTRTAAARRRRSTPRSAVHR